MAKIDSGTRQDLRFDDRRLETGIEAGSLGLDPALAERVFMTQRQIADMTLMMAREMMDFTTRRIRAQAEFVESLARCGNPQQLVETQMRFVVQTTGDYADEMNHIAKTVATSAVANEAAASDRAA